MSKSIKQGFLADLSWSITRLYEDFFIAVPLAVHVNTNKHAEYL